MSPSDARSSATTSSPASGTDSAGGDALADAVRYPCPPVPQQVAAGDTRVISLGDIGGDQVAIPLSFRSLPTCREVGDAVTSGNQTVTSATADFRPSDVGSFVARLFILDNTTISAVVNPTTVTMSQPARGSTTNSPLVICRVP